MTPAGYTNHGGNMLAIVAVVFLVGCGEPPTCLRFDEPIEAGGGISCPVSWYTPKTVCRACVDSGRKPVKKTPE